jgi:nucleoside-diphosphate-sugar epimerase
MKIFLTGASGYIGGSVANKLLQEGHQVYGLVRSLEKAQLIAKRGISPVLGSLDDIDRLVESAHNSDAVINAASSDHRPAVEALVKALAESGKTLIHTSGSSIVGDDARGESESPHIYADDSYFVPMPIRQARVAIDQYVRIAGVSRGTRTIVICPTTVYGTGRGFQVDSDQIPKLTKKSKESGAGLYLGKGVNRWSNVYIDDLVDLYLLALEKAPAASFFFAENGEESFKRIAESISIKLGFGGKTASWPADEAIAEYGDWARFALGSNSRVRAVNARRLLGWTPSGPGILEAIEQNI